MTEANDPLDELVLDTYHGGYQLSRFPESVFALTELQRLKLTHHSRLTAIPAQISSLKNSKSSTSAPAAFVRCPKSWPSSRDCWFSISAAT